MEQLFKTRAYAQLTPAESLRLAREFNELSQQQLAELAGIPQPAISAMERGDVQIGADRAARLARALQVHPAVILYPNWTDDVTELRRPRGEEPKAKTRVAIREFRRGSRGSAASRQPR